MGDMAKETETGVEAKQDAISRRVSAAEMEWQEKILKPALERSPERRRAFTTTSGVEIERLYTPADLPNFNYERDLGDPGEYPYTRGIHSTMYRGKIWTMRQFSGLALRRKPINAFTIF